MLVLKYIPVFSRDKLFSDSASSNYAYNPKEATPTLLESAAECLPQRKSDMCQGTGSWRKQMSRRSVRGHNSTATPLSPVFGCQLPFLTPLLRSGEVSEEGHGGRWCYQLLSPVTMHCRETEGGARELTWSSLYPPHSRWLNPEAEVKQLCLQMLFSQSSIFNYTFDCKKLKNKNKNKYKTKRKNAKGWETGKNPVY